MLAWSWGDREIAYQRTGGLFAISVADGRERMLSRLSLRINGAVPSGSWKITGINWSHISSDLLLNVDVCVPTGEPRTCKHRLVSVPFIAWFLPFFGRETTGWSKVFWSPAGDRLIFSTVVDEEFNSSYYVVNVRTRTRRTLLRNTSIDIDDWR